MQVLLNRSYRHWVKNYVYCLPDGQANELIRRGLAVDVGLTEAEQKAKSNGRAKPKRSTNKRPGNAGRAEGSPSGN